MSDHDRRGEHDYSLGHDPEELVRLERQAAAIERPTRLLLHAAGLAPGMRVLDLGTGLGHVARLAGDLVGPAGAVLGIDRSSGAIAVARQRAYDSGLRHVTFAEGDAVTWHSDQPFDAVVGRLLLFHVADPTGVVRHHIRNLRPGGSFIAIDFDLGGCRAEPPVQLVSDAIGWVEAAFRAAGAWPRIGARLGTILEDAGLHLVTTFGVQAYLSRDESGAALLAGVVRSLARPIVQHGIATAAEVDVVNLERRIAEELRRADAVMLTPTVAGAWGTVA